VFATEPKQIKEPVMPETQITRPSTGLQSWFGRDPLRTLRGEIDTLLSRFAGDAEGSWLSAPLPALDLCESNGGFEVKLDIPGFKADEIDIEVHGTMLRISGEHKEEKKEEKEEKGKTYHRVERRQGSFSRTVSLPCAVNEEKIKAECHDGVLTISLPKSESERGRKIKVQSKSA
jgi:HSP20 family protein